MYASTIRKQIKNGKFIINKEIKKFGKTWLMTKKAMKGYYGEMLLRIYIRNNCYNN
ncbi:helix-turn-helix domain-containing protein [Clostridioides sp. ES-S-0145-01]|uniref:helix-turn-helix domain-containing protein n=1 Tax=Clostridioides sp. ES-S-0145-01 TaxID=2770784 RepID=UPI001D11F7EC